MQVVPEKETQKHKRMVELLWRNTSILEHALKLQTVFVRGKEFVFDQATQEKADLIFQDKIDLSCPEPDTTCFVLELKSDIGDHEVVGQLKKAVQAMEKQGSTTRHWDYVVGVAIAKDFTDSGLKLLQQESYKVFRWGESKNGVVLHEVAQLKNLPLNNSLLEKIRASRKKCESLSSV